MSKELVARALEYLVDGYVLSRIVLNEVDMSLTHISLGAPALAALIRAVDDQYGTKYDEQDGFLHGLTNTPYPSDICTSCYAERQDGHAPDCRRWNTRVALLALCRDILGEKG